MAGRQPRPSLGALFILLAAIFAGGAFTSAASNSGSAAHWVVAVCGGPDRALVRRARRPVVPGAVASNQREPTATRRILPSVSERATEDLKALWREFRKTHDKAIRDRLILTYAPLVKFVAGRLGSGLPAHVDENDLVSYGLLGLIGAIERYDPDRDVKFETYAIARIKGAIIDELRAMDWVPRSVRARAREIERAMASLEAQLHRAPTDEEIAEKIGITEEELDDSLTDISRSSIAALDELWTISSSSGDQVALIDTIEDTEGPEPQAALDETEMREALGRGDRRAARAREARHHALLLRGADPARDRRGARRDRVARLAAPHEGDPAPALAARRRAGALARGRLTDALATVGLRRSAR